MFPKIGQKEKSESFLEESYTLFSETVYDSIEPGDNNNNSLFNFDLRDEDAPHYPIQIGWDERFQEFNPLDIRDANLLEGQIQASYGDFLEKISLFLEEAGNANT
jgi:hypothetical protein